MQGAEGNPPGLGDAAPASGDAAPISPAQQDIARDIGQQVEAMILAAKHQNEARVGKEVSKIKQRMEKMGEKIKTVNERTNKIDAAGGAGGGFLKADLARSIAKLEEVWEGEVSTLKHELWQTIQAHNHNSDLLKHHKDAIDAIQGRMTEDPVSPELELIHRQLMQVDQIVHREQAKQQQLDQFMHRLTAVQTQLNSGLAGMAAWGGGAGLMPPMPGGPAAAAAIGLPGVAAASNAAAAKKAARKNAKPAKAKAAPAAGPAAALNPNAAEFVFSSTATEFVPIVPGGDDG